MGRQQGSDTHDNAGDEGRRNFSDTRKDHRKEPNVQMAETHKRGDATCTCLLLVPRDEGARICRSDFLHLTLVLCRI
jgi:hypothetical protein